MISLHFEAIIFFFSKVPAFLNVVDIAGLVKGAAEGQGLGNAFLSHISACDAIFHLARKLFNKCTVMHNWPNSYTLCLDLAFDTNILC